HAPLPAERRARGSARTAERGADTVMTRAGYPQIVAIARAATLLLPAVPFSPPYRPAAEFHWRCRGELDRSPSWQTRSRSVRLLRTSSLPADLARRASSRAPRAS